MKAWEWIGLILVIGVPVALVAAGQSGLLRSQPPADIGLVGGMLRPPGRDALNVVSSQAAMHPHDERQLIEPLHFNDEPNAAFARLKRLVRSMPAIRIVKETPNYLHAEAETRLLKFVDDLEFVLDPPSHTIQVRSASRLGKRDFGVNRSRIESIREKFETGQTKLDGS